VSARVTRRGVTFLEISGLLGPDVGSPRQFTEHFFTFKASPACHPDERNHGLEADPLLVLLTWERDYSAVRRIDDGAMILRESTFDPLVAVRVVRLVALDLAEGGSRTSGEVIGSVGRADFAPFLTQRYDAPHEGLEVPRAGPRSPR